jgi:murein L,D-transpeptidase YafK
MFRVIILLLFVVTSFTSPKVSFKTAQLKYPRVKTAFQEKGKYMSNLYHDKKLNIKNAHIFIRVFKQEDELEIWAKQKNMQQFTKIKTYKICVKSGTIGPKARAGDGQVPEGLYQIDRFNPSSNFHLSLGLNYPNKADRLRAGLFPTGGDIFIHGDCVSIGCMPLTNEFIEEVYIACVEAKECLQKNIQVEIYPCKMTKENTSKIKKQFAKNTECIKIWSVLQKSFDYFENKHHPINHSFDAKGNYVLLP